MSHEVDLATGLAREPGDFEERLNANFLEDHVFLVRTPAVNRDFIDPKAAFTLEYVDLQLNMNRMNYTQLYVPSARAEFRLWEFGWKDVPYFVRRRSEEQARQTKQHLERKWGVEFPNTGFCNFVKFSIIRHVDIHWVDLPSRWHEQAGLVVSWFEMAGFNRHGDDTLGNVFPALRHSNMSAGLELKSRRELVSIAEVKASDWRGSGIADLLHFQESAVRVETRYQVEHMSLAVLRVPLNHGSPIDADLVRPLCGLIVRRKGDDVCWIYVAPHRYDHPVFQLTEWLLTRLRVGPRVALAMAMKFTNVELEPSAFHAQLQLLADAGVRVTMCGEHHWRCEVSYDFASDARLLAWRGRINSWPKVVRTLMPGAEDLNGLYSAMALLVCLGAAATAYSATQAKATVAVLALDYLLLFATHSLGILHVHAAHAAVLGWASRYAVLGPRWRRVLLCLWFTAFASVNLGLISRFEALFFATSVVALCSARRLYLALLTLQANHKPSLLLPLLMRLAGSLQTSPGRANLSDDALCSLDKPITHELTQRRRRALDGLRARWALRWLRSNELTAALCGVQCEAMPHECIAAAGAASTATRVAAAKATRLECRAEPSAGVGAVGADDMTTSTSPESGFTERTATPPLTHGADVAAVVADVKARLKSIAKLDEVRFHLSGAEALVAAARLARVNTGRPLLAAFGNGSHGWADGVSGMGVALGEERYACDVLTLREMSAATLKVVHMRREEISAVLVNPLHGLLGADHKGGPVAFRRWLHELRATCERAAVPLIFDECGTGFRLARGGAQEYFGVRADMVCYGKTAGTPGGLGIGVLCGSSRLLANSDPHLPLRAGTASGCNDLAENLPLMARTQAFLRGLDGPEHSGPSYASFRQTVSEWVGSVNGELAKEGLPLALHAEASIWSIRFRKPGRYHWVLQYYIRDEGARLIWLGPGRLGFPIDSAGVEPALGEAILSAARRMRQDGWWPEEHEVGLRADTHIKVTIAREVAVELVGALCHSVLPVGGLRRRGACGGA